MKKDYTIGLDIGTNTVGWAVMYDDYKIPSKKMKIQGNSGTKAKKKNFWGVRLFDDGKPASYRRIGRVSRRRLERQKNRIVYLQEIFEEEMARKDKYFFGRLQESFYQIDDKSIKEKCPLFGKISEEKEYYKSYPTIYHLRKKLVDCTEESSFGIDENGKADIRLIYLALHHAIKYRGHFLVEGDLHTKKSNIGENFYNFIKEYNELFTEKLSTELDLNAIESELKLKIPRSQKQKYIENIFKSKDKNFKEFIKLLVGVSANFKNLVGNDEDYKLIIVSEEYQEKLDGLLAIIGDEYREVFDSIKMVYDSVQLANILESKDIDSNALISSSMVERYKNHKETLAKLKHFIYINCPDKYTEIFRNDTKNGYAGYINGKTSEENFYKYMRSKLKDLPGSEVFLDQIANENFLRKQRTYDNGVIPYQLHLKEVEKIIDKQKQFYPFLEENRDKILSILKFRIPYYVGPLDKNNNSDFAWNVRKSDEAARPWNFEQIIDIDKSASKFIEKLINYDTYLPGEKVLPKHSLIYEKYTVFNELTKVRFIASGYDLIFLDGKQKSKIFDGLFKKHKKVSKKMLINFLEKELNFVDVQNVEGIEDKFNANYSTYIDLNKSGIDPLFLDSQEYSEYVEDIIKILTVFEDKKMRYRQLLRYEELLGEEVIIKLSQKHFTGWGRLSKKLLVGIYDRETGKTILDFLEEDDDRNRNFMQLINDNELSFKRIIMEQQSNKNNNSFENVVSDLSGSPAIKKGILQSLKIVDELVEIMGYKPKNVVIEMARENQTTSKGKKLSKAREKKIQEGLSNLKAYEVYVEGIDENYTNFDNEKIYLYYMQNGKDMYTGETLDIHNLSSYDVDHIIPRSFITDNSIDNKVLTKSKANRGMTDNVPSEDIIKNMRGFWNKLHRSQLISDKKMANLTKGKLTDADKNKFIQRQLVETRQISKNVASILYSYFNLDKNNEKVSEDKLVNIITLKASLTSQFKSQFGIYKVRDINDYHHAHDAYLNCVVATTLLKLNPKLEPCFVYGSFKKFTYKGKNKASQAKKFDINLINNLQKSFHDENGEVLWNYSEDIKTIKKVLSSKQMNITKKLETRASNEDGKLLFKQTIAKSKKNGGGSGKNNIKTRAKRADGTEFVLDLDSYGGYIEQKEAFITISNNKLISVKRIEADKYKGFKQIKRNQVFMQEEGLYRTVSSLKESGKWGQLVFDNKETEYIYKLQNMNHYEKGDEYIKYVESHRKVFNQLKTKIFDYIEKNKLANLKDIYIPTNMTIEDEKEVIIALLGIVRRGTTSDSSYTRITSEGKEEKIIVTKRIRYNTKKDRLKLNSSILVNYSVTGLYESRIILGD